MSNKLFIGNLSYNATEESLREAFSQVGTVQSAVIIMDRDTNRSKGFGFVEMATEQEAQTAIEKLHDTELDGRKMIVTIARPKEDKGSRY
jgi:RNA recognition motif-containing protein